MGFTNKTDRLDEVWEKMLDERGESAGIEAEKGVKRASAKADAEEDVAKGKKKKTDDDEEEEKEEKKKVEESAYQDFFKKKLKEAGYNSINDMDDAEKKKFFNMIDKEWTGEKS